MAGVTTREEAPPYAAPAPQWGVATRKYVTEFIGTFFLTFAVGVGALSGSAYVPLAAGATLMVMVYAGGHISGGVFNPAVALGGATAGLFGWSTIWVYLLVQLAAGTAAGLAFLALNPGDK